LLKAAKFGLESLTITTIKDLYGVQKLFFFPYSKITALARFFGAHFCATFPLPERWWGFCRSATSIIETPYVPRQRTAHLTTQWLVAELEKLRHSHTSRHASSPLTLQSVSYRWL